VNLKAKLRTRRQDLGKSRPVHDVVISRHISRKKTAASVVISGNARRAVIPRRVPDSRTKTIT
jgi:hypothetical protein